MDRGGTGAAEAPHRRASSDRDNDRPFTTMGTSVLELQATQLSSSSPRFLNGVSPRVAVLQPLADPDAPVMTKSCSLSAISAAARPRSRPNALRDSDPEHEFDVRKFLLSQKSSDVPHPNDLFRSSSVFRGAGSTTKKRLPRMGMHPDHRTEEQLAGSRNGERGRGRGHGQGRRRDSDGDGEGDPVLTHFYTLEKMAAGCSLAVLSRNKTWQFLPGADERTKTTAVPVVGGNNVGAARSTGSSANYVASDMSRPSRRVDVLDLTACLDAAMQFVKKNTWDVPSSARMALLDRDITTIRARVLERFPCAMPTTIETSRRRHHNDGSGEEKNCNISADEATPEATAPSTLPKDQQTLVTLLFAQKWADVVLGELEAMLTTSFLEQGVLLRKARIQAARAFFSLDKLHEERSERLYHVEQELAATRRELRDTIAAHERDVVEMRASYEREIERLGAGFEGQREELEQRLADSKEQMSKMSDTMKALNAIFRQMREDTDKVNAVELRDNYAKLERRCEQMREELERLRPLKALMASLTEQKDATARELEAMQARFASVDEILVTKDTTIAELMEQQSEMLAAQELRMAQEEERRRQEEEELADEEEEEEEEDNTSTGEGGGDVNIDGEEQSIRQKRRKKNKRASATVCVRCKLELRQMAENGMLVDGAALIPGGGSGHDATRRDSTHADGQYHLSLVSGGGEGLGAGGDHAGSLLKQKRVPCLYFRILLPNLRGRRPQRDISWTLGCMRAILFAKQIDDAMCRHRGGPFPKRIRMPEFVYAWFSPWRSLQQEKQFEMGLDDSNPASAVKPIVNGTTTSTAQPHGEDLTSQSSCASVTMTAQRAAEQRLRAADEDRWCLYYGVKALVREGYLEAKLFLSLLDEKYGEDEQVFLLYCYRILDVLLGGKLRWGDLRDHISYESFRHEYERVYAPSVAAAAKSTAIPGHGSGNETSSSAPRIPKTVWISPYHASLATSVVLFRASETDRAALDEKLLAFAVTNLSAEERPAVYLSPTGTAGGGTETRSGKSNAKAKNITTSRVTKSRVHQIDDDDDGGGDNNIQTDDEHGRELKFIDANLWAEIMMMEYKEEQAHRRAAIRLMFQTAAITAAPAGSTNHQNHRQKMGSMTALSSAVMDMEQFRIMLHTLNDELPSFTVAELFRAAFDYGRGAVTFDAFMAAAETAQFFSSCLRLESPASCIARLAGTNVERTRAVPIKHDSNDAVMHSLPSSTSACQALTLAQAQASLSTSSRAAFVVDKFFTLLQHEVTTSIAALPLGTRSATDAIAYEIASSLGGDGEGGGTFSDGIRLLTAFHRLLESLLMATVAKREVTGAILSSKSVQGLEKALYALLECVRMRDKSTVEVLIDTVKQKLCVQRVQQVFRRHLRHNEGAPLVMRPLLHHGFGLHRRRLRETGGRRTERPLPWLRYIISDVLRRSLRLERVAPLLLQLSSVSSILLQNAAANQRTSWTLNGGIGPAPKPLLVELIYDYFLERFGTRWEAEKLIHDVFAYCRTVADGVALVELFALLTGMCLRPEEVKSAGSEAVTMQMSSSTSGTSGATGSGSGTGTGGKGKEDDTTGESRGDDRLMSQNEALAFVHGILRCGLHNFRLINPQSTPPPSAVTPAAPDTRANSNSLILAEEEDPDVISQSVAEEILFAAFSKLGEDQKQRVRARLDEQRLLRKPSASTTSSGKSSPQFLLADAFLVLALREWKRYVAHRLHELRVICCSMDDEMAQFEHNMPLDALASVLQRANVPFSNEELCAVFRRVCTTERMGHEYTAAAVPSEATTFHSHDATTSASASASTSASTAAMASNLHTMQTPRAHELMSDRVAAACFPLIAQEPLLELQRLEHAAQEPFRVQPNAQESARFLVASWRAYDAPCRRLLDELRRLGKMHDIQASTISRRDPMHGGGGGGSGGYGLQRGVLYLSSSAAAHTLSSQDVAQLDALFKLFLERLDKMADELQDHEEDEATRAARQALQTQLTSKRRISIATTGTFVMDEQSREELMHSRVAIVNETWKMFRQLLVAFARLRSLAGLGDGPLPDQWDTIEAPSLPTAMTRP